MSPPLLPPPTSLAHVMTLSLTVSGTIEAFDATSLQQSIALMLNVNASTVEVSAQGSTHAHVVTAWPLRTALLP
jgi:hypothetical protein